MRTTWLALALIGLFGVVGCGNDDAQHGGGADMAVPDGGGGAGGHDMATPTMCSMTPQTGDGEACSMGCTANQIGVNVAGGCKCYAKCNAQPDCSCDRLCDTVSFPDGGATLQACLPANSAGERCGRMANGQPYFGVPYCNQLTVCLTLAQSFAYCNYRCKSNSDCPAQTTCQPLFDSQGNPDGLVCAYNSGPNGTKNQGDACMLTDVCKGGLLCSGSPGTCLPQCDGPGATCAQGTCTEVDDPAKPGMVIGYVCK